MLQINAYIALISEVHGKIAKIFFKMKSQPLLSYFFLCVIFLFLGCSPSQKEAKSEDSAAPKMQNSLNFTPNIVWLVAEDLSPVLPPFGDSTISTPTISRLAREGVVYTHVFSPSGVCAPSRAAIATGMYQNHIGAQHMRTGPWVNEMTPEMKEAAIKRMASYWPPNVPLYEAIPPAETKMHSEYLRRKGYYCTNKAKEDYQFVKPATAWDESSNKAHWRNRKPGQPFFAIFNFGVTHESQIWAKTKDSLWVDESLEVPVPPYLPDNAIGQRDVRRMYSNIREMDYQVGQVLAELEADGLLDSTIIFWYTDHGGPLPRQKRLLYDSGMRLPMIIRFPDQWRAGEVDDQLISFIDFKPTILSLAGIEPPEYIDGRAFLGPFADSPERTYIHGAADRFDEQYDMIRAVRDHQFKYLRNFSPEKGYYLPVGYREQMAVMKELLRLRESGELNEYQSQWFRSSKEPEELFDTEKDPHELQNLATDPAYAKKLEELRAECDRWMEEIDDLGLIPELEFIEKIWPGGIQPNTKAPEFTVEAGKVVINCATEGASLGFQILSNGAEAGKSWQIYQNPVMVKPGEQLMAISHRIGYLPNQAVYEEAKK